jgi:hypothetical protein
VDSRIGFVVASSAFTLPPPLLCVAFVVQRWHVGDSGRVLLVVAVSFVLLIWAYALLRGLQVMRWIRTTDQWLMHETAEIPT